MENKTNKCFRYENKLCVISHLRKQDVKERHRKYVTNVPLLI